MKPHTFENTSRTIDAVIICAGTQFKRFGFRGTTVDSIAHELRISKRTLYGLFSSKGEILREVAWRDTLESVRRFGETVPPETPSERILLALCRYIFTDRIQEGKSGRFSGIHGDDPDLRDAYREALRRVLAHIYEDAMQRGRLKPVDPEYAAEALLSLITAALGNFHRTRKPLKVFNDTLVMIADAVAYRDRVPFDAMG
jgi:AcrR family transcriptional regulator